MTPLARQMIRMPRALPASEPGAPGSDARTGVTLAPQNARFVHHAVEQLWSRAVAAARNPTQNDALGKPQE